ncbi:MAG: hypothetical protein AAF623_18360 [Planctomycetota bacterium]
MNPESQNDGNPFSSPNVSLEPTNMKRKIKSNEIANLAKDVFLSWEKLRIPYVAIMGIFCVLLAGKDILKLDLLIPVVVGGIFANLCFLAAPIVEVYLRWIGIQTIWVKIILFPLGTLFTMILAFAVLNDFNI